MKFTFIASEGNLTEPIFRGDVEAETPLKAFKAVIEMHGTVRLKHMQLFPPHYVFASHIGRIKGDNLEIEETGSALELAEDIDPKV